MGGIVDALTADIVGNDDAGAGTGGGVGSGAGGGVGSEGGIQSIVPVVLPEEILLPMSKFLSSNLRVRFSFILMI